MTEVSLKYSALYYLNQWISKDKRYSETLATTDKKAKLEILNQAAGFYRVGRNLPKAGDEGNGFLRYEPVLAILDGIKASEFTIKNVIEKIDDISGKISAAYKTNGTTSLTSKFVWQKVKSPVVIYDSRVRTALKLNSTVSYKDYYACWYAEYANFVSDIKLVCEGLADVHEYVIDQEIGTRNYIESIAKESWFQERVFDIYLWHGGTLRPKAASAQP